MIPLPMFACKHYLHHVLLAGHRHHGSEPHRSADAVCSPLSEDPTVPAKSNSRVFWSPPHHSLQTGTVLSTSCQVYRSGQKKQTICRSFLKSHSSFLLSLQVKLSNPSGKPLQYQVLVAGHDARDFCVPKGDQVTIPPKSTLHLNVEFTSRFLRPAEAILVLVGRRHGSAVGSTLTFNLRTQIDNITPKVCEFFIYSLFFFVLSSFFVAWNLRCWICNWGSFNFHESYPL